jgi:hypothetical protein
VPVSNHLKVEVFAAENIAALQTEECAGLRRFRRSQADTRFPGLDGASHVQEFLREVPQDFRHTVITNRIAAGVPIQAVASLAGRCSVAVTLERHNHATLPTTPATWRCQSKMGKARLLALAALLALTSCSFGGQLRGTPYDTDDDPIEVDVDLCDSACDPGPMGDQGASPLDTMPDDLPPRRASE